MARVGLGVTVTKPTVKAARDAAGTSMNAIIAALKAPGIDDPVRALEEAIRARGVPASAFRILGFGESTSSLFKDTQMLQHLRLVKPEALTDVVVGARARAQ